MKKLKIDFKLSVYGEVEEMSDIEAAELEEVLASFKRIAYKKLADMGMLLDFGVGQVAVSLGVEDDGVEDDGDAAMAAYIERVLKDANNPKRCNCERCQLVRSMSERHDMDAFMSWLLTPLAQRADMLLTSWQR